MAVIRVQKNKNYTIMANYHLHDKNLSLKAKGLLSYMFSLPEDWDYSVKGLCKLNKEGVKAIRAILQEMEKAGYLIRTRFQDEKGCFDYRYDIYEKPQPQTPQPCTQNGYALEGYALEGCTQKDTQLNTNILSTKELSTKEPTTKQMSQPAKPVPTRAPESLMLAKKLYERIMANKPNRKVDKNWEENWSLDIERLHRLDGRSWEEIERIIDWSQDHYFWRTNILSGKKLRDQVDALEDQMARDKNKPYGGGVLDLNTIN